jgi:hypothetical protein
MAEENGTADGLSDFRDADRPPDLAWFYDIYEDHDRDYETDLVSLREGLNVLDSGRGLTREEIPD